MFSPVMSLGASLDHLHDAVKEHAKKSEESIKTLKDLPLIAGPFGRRIYLSTSFFGKVLALFYRVIASLVKKDFQAKKWERAINHINTLAKETLDQHGKDIQRFVKYVQEQSIATTAEDPKLVKEMVQLRKRFVNATNSLLPFFKMLNGKETDVQKRIFALSPHLTFLKKNQELLRSWARCRKIIDLEGRLQKPFPYRAIREILCRTGDENITADENVFLKQWVYQIKTLGYPRTDNRILHKALQAFIQTLEESEKALHFNRLYIGLNNADNTFFQNEDPKQIAWRNSLKKGDTVEIRGHTFIIEQELGNPDKDDNKIKVFSLTDDHYVLVSGTHRTIHAIDLAKRTTLEKVHWPIARIVDIDRKGRFALMEKLSTASEAEVKDEISKIKPVIASLAQIASQTDPNDRMIEVPLKAKFWGFDNEKAFKCMKIVNKHELNFLDLFSFIVRLSGKNKDKVREFSNIDVINKHLYVTFWNRIAEDALAKRSVKFERKAALEGMGISDPKVISLGKKLYNRIRRLMKKHSTAMIRAHYLSYGSAAALWPTFEQDLGSK